MAWTPIFAPLPVPGQGKAGDVPDWVLGLARDQIIDRIGYDLMDKYVTYREDLSRFYPRSCADSDPCAEEMRQPRYSLVFSYGSQQVGSDHLTFSTAFDPEGQPIGRPVYLPDCIADPSKCQITVSKNGALELAMKELEEEHVTRWNPPQLFFSMESRGLMVWRVGAITTDPPRDCGNSGIGLEIDATTGEVRQRNQLFETC